MTSKMQIFLIVLLISSAIVYASNPALSLKGRLDKLIGIHLQEGIWQELDSLKYELKPISLVGIDEDVVIDLEAINERLQGTTMFRARFLQEGYLQRTLTIPVRIRSWRNMIVAAEDLKRGLILSAGDFNSRLIENTSLNDGDILQARTAIGQRLCRYVKKGDPLFGRMLRPVADLIRGSEIRLLISTGGVVVSAPATLEKDARIGELVPLRLVDTGKRVRAILRSRTEARLEVGS
jgi:flagella basal body P-ring formation protein FlgA